MDEDGFGFIDVTTMGTVVPLLPPMCECPAALQKVIVCWLMAQVSHILHMRATHYEWQLLFGVQVMSLFN